MSIEPLRVVLIGLGPVGVRFAEELLPAIDAGRIRLTIVGAEHEDPYNRVQLAEYAVGAADADELVIADVASLTAAGADVRLGRRAVALERADRRVRLDDGSAVAYDRLVLATGARANVPALDGLDRHDASETGGDGLDDGLLDGVRVLRSMPDATHVREVVAAGGRVVVLGAGVLGIELALLLAAAGADTVVAHFGPIPMPRQLDRGAASVLRGALEDAGVTVEPHSRAEAVIAHTDSEGRRRFRGLVSSDGRVLEGDLLVLSCGVTARVELAADAGLRIGRGILVDDTLRSWSDPAIFAIGDCAHVADPVEYLHEAEVPGAPSGLVGPGWRQAEWLARSFVLGQDGESVSPFVEDVPGIVLLKSEGVELVAAGDVSPEPFAPVPRGEEAPGVSVWADPEHGAYTKMVTMDGILTGFVSVGMPRAAAELSVLYGRRGELPADRSLLLRLDGTPDAPRREGRDAQVCMCNAVTAGAIEDAISGGSTTVAEVGRCTRAGTGCGGCRSRISAMLAEIREREATPA